MITPDEREEIITAAVERALLALPEVVGNLIVNHVKLAKLNREFYSSHPELASHKDVVASVVELVEGKNTLDDYETLLQKSIPEIKKRLEVMKGLDTKTITKPNRDLSKLSLDSDHGEL